MAAGGILQRLEWRRLGFAAFCLLLVAVGFTYLGASASDGPPAKKSLLNDWQLEQALRGAVWPALILLAALALASPWLVGRGPLPALSASGGNREPAGRRFWLAALLLTVIAATLWGGRLGASLWTDESRSMRLLMVGRWKHDGEGSGCLLRPSWIATVMDYQTPNNHVLYSVAARVVHERLAGVNEDDFERPYFSERVLRLPAFVAALLSISLVGYLALRVGSLLAAWLAMSWAVLHPWYLEFATSARGYSFAMCGLALAAVALVKIFTGGGGWRWWGAYGFGQVAAFLSMPTVVHTLIFLNAAAFIVLLLPATAEWPARSRHLRAFFATNLVAAAFAYVGFGSKLDQVRAYVSSGHFKTQMGLDWLGDCISRILVGQPYATWAEGHPLAHATEQWPTVLLALGAGFAVLVAVAALLGCWRRGVFTGLLAIAVFTPPLTTYLQGRVSEFYMFPWYVVWQLPLLLALMSVGAAWLLQKIPAGRREATAGGAVLVLAIGLATARQLVAYLQHPVEGQRESAAAMRESPNPFAPGHRESVTTALVTANHAYDPWNVRLRDADDLWLQIAEAERGGRPLFCDTAWIEAVRRDLPECGDLLLDSGGFEQRAKILGLQPQNTRYVFRYRPGSLRSEAAARGLDVGIPGAQN